MKIYLINGIILLFLLILELVYFKIADRYNIIDKPNERSSHSSLVLRGGGIIFLLGVWVWTLFYGFLYPWFLAGITLIGGMSFIDDVHSLPNLLRLVVQFFSMVLMFYQLDILQMNMWLVIVISMIVFVGATNIINFMDGINGITVGYSATVLLSLYIVNEEVVENFIEPSFLTVILFSLIIFSYFNFRPNGKAKCFAGDVGSISIAFIILFAIGKLILQTKDITWLVFLLVYGVDGCLTIIHRIMLHEKLGLAHRKHVYQLMANELKMCHTTVSCIYMTFQLIISLTFIYICPNSLTAHWIYLIITTLVLVVVYITFIKKYYYLHEEYLSGIKNN